MTKKKESESEDEDDAAEAGRGGGDGGSGMADGSTEEGVGLASVFGGGDGGSSSTKEPEGEAVRGESEPRSEPVRMSITSSVSPESEGDTGGCVS